MGGGEVMRALPGCRQLSRLPLPQWHMPSTPLCGICKVSVQAIGVETTLTGQRQNSALLEQFEIQGSSRRMQTVVMHTRTVMETRIDVAFKHTCQNLL